MYSVADRDAVRDRVLELARSDPRVVGAAVVGSLVLGGDRWSDLDLTFGVGDDTPVADVLSDWTKTMAELYDAVVLFDLQSGDIIYRVFFLPGGLQVDLSFTPASRFGAGGPRFRLLFGETHERPPPTPPAALELFGWAVAYARDARACIERGKLWQAEHCVAAIRDHALALACRRRGLPTRFGRGYDDLPPEVLKAFEPTLVSTLTPESLLTALRIAVEGPLSESMEVGEVAEKSSPWVREVIEAPSDPA